MSSVSIIRWDVFVFSHRFITILLLLVYGVPAAIGPHWHHHDRSCNHENAICGSTNTATGCQSEAVDRDGKTSDSSSGDRCCCHHRHLIAAERMPRNRVQNPIMAVVGQAWRTIAGFAPFVSIRRNPRSQRLPLRLLAWRTVLGRSTSGPIHRSDLSSLPCMLADHPQPSSAPRVEGLTGLILSSRTGKMSAPPRASCPS